MEELETPPTQQREPLYGVDLIRTDPSPGGTYSFRHSPPTAPATETISPSSSASEEEQDEQEVEATKPKRKLAKVARPQPPRSDPRPEPYCSLCSVLTFVAFCLVMGGMIWYHSVTLAQGALPVRREPLYEFRNAADTESTLTRPLDDLTKRHAIVERVEASLRHYLHERYQPCVCMHHLSVAPPLWPVCAVPHLPLMVNPKLKGRGNETDERNELSVACPGQLRRRLRYRSIILEWQDLGPDGETMWAFFEGATAACLQLALDEMTLGNKICT